MTDSKASAGQEELEAGGKLNTSQNSVGQQAIKSGLEGATLAMKDAPPFQKAVVYACYIALCIAVIGLVIPPYNAGKQIGVILAIVGLMGLTVLLILSRYDKLVGNAPAPLGGGEGNALSAPSAKHLIVTTKAIGRSVVIMTPIVAVLVIIIIAYGAMRAFGYDPIWNLAPAWHQSIQSGSLQSALIAGIAQRKPYICESVVMLVRVDDSLGEQKLRKATVRTAYMLRPLRDIGNKDLVFEEDYSSEDAKAPPIRWHGTDVEEIQEAAHTLGYNVRFSGDHGDTRTIVTGATITYDLPLPDNRNDHGILHLRPNEQVWFYKNSQDFIAELTIVIESSTTDLTVDPQSAVRLDGTRVIETTDATIYPRARNQSDRVTIVNRWQNVKPGQNCAIRFSWPSP